LLRHAITKLTMFLPIPVPLTEMREVFIDTFLDRMCEDPSQPSYYFDVMRHSVKAAEARFLRNSRTQGDFSEVVRFAPNGYYPESDTETFARTRFTHPIWLRQYFERYVIEQGDTFHGAYHRSIPLLTLGRLDEGSMLFRLQTEIIRAITALVLRW